MGTIRACAPLLVFALLTLAAAARAACPYASTIRMCALPPSTSYRDSVYTSTAPSLTISGTCTACTGSITCEGFPLGPVETVEYDIPTGLVYANVQVRDTPANTVAVTADDQYWIIGPTTGSAMSCTAQFAVSGYGYYRCSGATSITVQGQTASASFYNDGSTGPPNATPPLSGVLSLPVIAAVGAPFEVKLSGTINPINSSSVYVRGTLSFAGLPAGYAVVSCNGFGGGATSVRPRTWGSLKSVYR